MCEGDRKNRSMLTLRLKVTDLKFLGVEVNEEDEEENEYPFIKV